MTLRLTQMSNELFEELSKYYPILAVAPGEVKDKNAFFFSVCNTPFTAIIGQDFYNDIMQNNLTNVHLFDSYFVDKNDPILVEVSKAIMQLALDDLGIRTFDGTANKVFASNMFKGN